MTAGGSTAGATAVGVVGRGATRRGASAGIGMACVGVVAVEEMGGVGSHIRLTLTGMIGCGVVIHWSPGVAHIVGVAVVRVVVRVGMMPSGLMHMVVVGASVGGMVVGTGVGVVGRYAPGEGGHGGAIAETQIGGGVVESVVAPHEPDAAEVDGHIYLLASPSVVAEEPHLVVLRVDTLVPNLVDEAVGLNLVGIAAPYHQFVLRVEIVDSAFHLAEGEIAHLVGTEGEGEDCE